MHVPRRSILFGARRGGALAVAALAATLLLAPWSARADAVDLQDPFGAMNWSGGKAFVYVEAGETLAFSGLSRLTTYTITDPDGVAQTLTRADGTVVGTSCTALGGGSACAYEGVATTTGVWMLTAAGSEPFSASSTYPQVIDVSAADGTPRPGRLWFEPPFDGFQHINNVTDVTMHLLSPSGVQYQVELHELAGYGNTFNFNNKGVVYAGTCESTYFSVPRNGGQQPEPDGGLVAADYSVNVGACPDLVTYRIFAEAPDPAMPAEVALWADGRTTNTWVYQDYQAPALDAPALARTETSSAGTITSTLSGQPGRVGVAIDVDGNGSFDDPVDRTIDPQPFGLGPVDIAWDGLDGLGNPVSPLAPITIELTYQGEAELHLTLSDTEGLNGGLTLVRLNGPDAPQSTVSWDDSHLLARPSDIVIAAPVGDDVASDGGVRGWQRGAAATGWGDSRDIDTWTTYDTSVTASATIDPVTPGVPLVDPMVLAGAVVVAGVVAAHVRSRRAPTAGGVAAR